jgi:hypothetical protein
MSEAELLRLKIALRAYRAAEPSAAEVQAGVRRARLALRRPVRRRLWLVKAVGMAVLAVGGLAYAKPRALGELVSQTWSAIAKRAPKRGLGSSAALAPRSSEQRALAPAPSAAVAPPTALPTASAASASVDSASLDWASVDSARVKAAVAAPTHRSRAVAGLTAPSEPGDAPASPSVSMPTAPPSGVSDWGRVGAALARGDEQAARQALTDLSASDDARTRDKADLGRAQLDMAAGKREAACSLLRSLTHRRAGGRIERQALALLRDCAP